MSLRRTALIGVAAGSAAAAGVAALALTASTSQASTNGATSPARPAMAKAWVFQATTTQHHDTDTGAHGPSVGDRYAFSDDLTMWGKDAKVGTDGGECLVVNVVKDDGKAKDATMQCTATLSLKGGQVTVQGLGKWSDKVFHVAVTGGTGAFTGAVGTLDVEEKSDTVAKLTLRLNHAGFSHLGAWDEGGDDWSVGTGDTAG